MLNLKDPKFDRFGNVSTLKELTMIIKNNRIIPFVGAGMSIDIYGSWDSALEKIMGGHIFGKDADVVNDLIKTNKFEEAAEEISGLLGETDFQDQLVAVFGEPKITDEALKKMPVRYLPRIFKDSLAVTSNFDKVLERVFLMEQHSFEEKVVLSHLTGWQAERSKCGTLHYLIKIHGCVSAPDEVVMTKKSYGELYHAGSQPIARLRSILGANKLLFLGCSLNKDRTVALLREVGQGDHYAILGMNGEAGEEAFQKRKRHMSNDLKMHCIWYPKGEHHYVEDILEYIYAEITGQHRLVETEAPEALGIEQKSTHTKKKEPAKPTHPVTKPLVKNEIYTMGNWNEKPVDWLVLDVRSDKALLIAKDCLLTVPYNKERQFITWEECSLRNELLPQLLKQLFDDTESERILLSKNKNPNNARWKTPGGKDTDDKLFLLRIDEVIKYFPYDEARIAKLNGEPWWWWLRSPGRDSRGAAIVNGGGSVYDGGVDGPGVGVRPAFWLNLES